MGRRPLPLGARASRELCTSTAPGSREPGAQALGSTRSPERQQDLRGRDPGQGVMQDFTVKSTGSCGGCWSRGVTEINAHSERLFLWLRGEAVGVRGAGDGL